jgi:hypothetical protein
MIRPASRSPRLHGVARAAQPLAEPRRSTAALPPAGGQLHLHFHGLTAEDIAAILARHQDGQA